MAKTRKSAAKNSKTDSEDTIVSARPKSLAVAAGGIRTAGDFADFMSTLMTDVVDGRVSPATCNAACNAGGKLLKIVEIQMRQETRGKRKGSVPELLLVRRPG